MPDTLSQYADACIAERLAKKISDDVLSFAEIDDDELEDILKAVRHG